MFEYYQVNKRYNFTHYGKATTFANQINGSVEVKKTNNLFRVMLAAI